MFFLFKSQQVIVFIHVLMKYVNCKIEWKVSSLWWADKSIFSHLSINTIHLTNMSSREKGRQKTACLFLNHLTNLRTMWLNKQWLCFSYSLTIQALCLLLLCSFRLIYHGPVNFGILSKTMHGDVLEIAWLSAISSRALKEASNHARQHLSLGKLIFKLKTHNLRPLMFTKSGSKTFWEAFKKKRKATLAVFCCNTKH